MKTFPKKRLGQHFLRDTGTLKRIIKVFQPSPNDVVVEIGAGNGALAAKISPSVSRLLAIEIDSDQISSLEAALTPYPQASFVRGDFLKLDLEGLLTPHLRGGCRLRIVGNLPYNIATAVIERLFCADLVIDDMLFMVQLEVAERIIAPPCSRQYGYLSVLCQHRAEVRIEFKVPPSCFVPRPKVMSAVLSIHPRNRPGNRHVEGSLSEIVKAAFAYRRKTLLNSFRQSATLGPIAEAVLSRAGINGGRRAEDLSVQEYESLAIQLRKHRDCLQPAKGSP